MSDDSIVTEVRLCRATLLQTAGGTVDTLVQCLREHEAEAGRTPVPRHPQAPAPSPRAG